VSIESTTASAIVLRTAVGCVTAIFLFLFLNYGLGLLYRERVANQFELCARAILADYLAFAMDNSRLCLWIVSGADNTTLAGRTATACLCHLARLLHYTENSLLFAHTAQMLGTLE
jgi:hypothetical protein